jgi:hypothetical protein
MTCPLQNSDDSGARAHVRATGTVRISAHALVRFMEHLISRLTRLVLKGVDHYLIIFSWSLSKTRNLQSALRWMVAAKSLWITS